MLILIYYIFYFKKLKYCVDLQNKNIYDFSCFLKNGVIHINCKN